MGAVDTTTLLLIGGGVLVGGFILYNMSKQTAQPVIIRQPTPTNTGAATTAAEIAAGASVLNTALNDFSDNGS